MTQSLTITANRRRVMTICERCYYTDYDCILERILADTQRRSISIVKKGLYRTTYKYPLNITSEFWTCSKILLTKL